MTPQTDEAVRGLIERLEKTTEPDRGLDAAIAVEIDFGCEKNLPDDLQYNYLPTRDDYCQAGTYWFKQRSGASLRSAPNYTGSIDAALTLVPAHLMMAMAGPYEWAEHHPRAGEKIWEVALDTGGMEEWCIGDYAEGDMSGRGPTLAIALCIAALRARLAQKENKL